MGEEEKLEYAHEQCTEARRLTDSVSERMEDHTVSVPQLLRDLQEAVELSVKSMFFGLGLEEPKKDHGISFNHANDLLTADFPDGFERADDIPRAVFLTQFWSQFYTTAKYGDETRTIPPNQIFTRLELKLAMEHAVFCRGLCRDLIQARRAELRS